MGLQQTPAPNLLRPSAPGLSRERRRVATWSLRVTDTLFLWLERYRERRALSGLSDHMLKDLGLSRSDAGRESGKRFWEG
jgi:uncharacterized protein YjiS (DUF1127 family)